GLGYAATAAVQAPPGFGSPPQPMPSRPAGPPAMPGGGGIFGGGGGLGQPPPMPGMGGPPGMPEPSIVVDDGLLGGDSNQQMQKMAVEVKKARQQVDEM